MTDLDSEQRALILPSGQFAFENRIAWAASYLSRVDAIYRPQRGRYSITEFGRELLRQHPNRIREADLRAVAKSGDEWWLKRRAVGDIDAQVDEVEQSSLDPVEQIEVGINLIHNGVRSELLRRLLEREPTFFESAIVKLLVAMGYGGTGGASSATRLVHDGGIDGVIDQDVLGLNKIYIQAKRYSRDNSVQRPEIQAFVGALSGNAEQGVFITTSRFSSGAIEYAERDARVRVILIDGLRLTELMIRFGVGVQVKQTLHIVEIDEDFFE